MTRNNDYSKHQRGPQTGHKGHTPRKRFGQNFLRDDAVINAIARAIAPQADEHLVEIGPGEGALTQSLVTSQCQLDAIELDRDLHTHLLAAFSIYPHFKLHSADALKFDFGSLLSSENTATEIAAGKLRVVGNLPYNISTPLIFKLLDNASIIADMHFMLQREVVERLAASPGSKDWGRLGIMAQYQCEVTHLFDVPPDAFFPPPKVQSAIVRLAPRVDNPYPPCELESLRLVVRSAFAQRRKTLRNNFKDIFDDQQLQGLEIDPAARAETLALTDFVALANLYSALQTAERDG